MPFEFTLVHVPFRERTSRGHFPAKCMFVVRIACPAASFAAKFHVRASETEKIETVIMVRGLVFVALLTGPGARAVSYDRVPY